MNPSILVTGASGPFGQRVLHHLLETLSVPAGRVAAASRDASKLTAGTTRGVATRSLDFEQPEGFANAFDGIERALLISTDALDRPGRRLAQHRNAIRGMEAAGVRHVVYTSAPDPEDSPLLIAPDHAGTEHALADSALPGWTVLRNHWYFENLFHSLPAAIASGVWYAADGGQGSADIARDDLALAAAIVLAGDGQGRQVYTLSGEQALTKQQIARTVSEAIGKPIQVEQVPLEGLVEGMVLAGVPEGFARVLASFDTNTAAGRVAPVSGDFERITGRRPTAFTDWVIQNRAALAAL